MQNEDNLCTTVFNCLHGVAPVYLSTVCQSVSENLGRRCLRSAARGDLAVPASRTVHYCPRGFAVVGPSTWNSANVTAQPAINTDIFLSPTEDLSLQQSIRFISTLVTVIFLRGAKITTSYIHTYIHTHISCIRVNTASEETRSSESWVTRRYTVDSVVGTEVTVPEREIKTDYEPQRELEPSAEHHVGRQLQLEREGVCQATIITSIGTTWRKICCCVVAIRRPVVHRISHRHLQYTARVPSQMNAYSNAHEGMSDGR